MANKEDTRYYFMPREEYQPQDTYVPEGEFYPREDEAYSAEEYDPAYDQQEMYAYPEQEDDDLDYLDDEAYYEEKKMRRIGRFRVAAGVLDFLGVIGGMIVVLLLAALLISLINWLWADILRTFTILQTRL